ncbi:MAG: sensor histidine kinase [Bacteroidetes bacterium]|nr:MAG: sensor histidine kinase [Bacteroidota bacterium]MBL1145225.1 sensor histidine kinase [Bacteroidota bacterium]NOG58021.1 HAMP domain-containing histidine kinase [Bacteroidota bacterium]
MNMRIRFTLMFTLIVGVMLCFFSFAIYFLSEEYRKEDFHSRLQNRAIEKLELLIKNDLKVKEQLSNQMNDNRLHSLENESITIYDSNNRLIYNTENKSIPNPESIKSLSNQTIYSWSDENTEGIGFLHPYQGKTYALFSSATDKHGTSYINHLKRTLLIRLIIIMLIIFLSGWVFAGYFIKPIINIVKQTDNITSKNLSYRLKTEHVKDEIGKLTTTFNKMLDRLETSFTIQKRFVSNASHELRNPLTAIGGQIDVTLMKDRKKEEYRATLESVSVHIKNLKTLTNNLLELANNDVDTLFQEFREIRIDEILWDIRDEIQKQNPDRNLKINFEKITDNEKTLTCKGKAELLEIAFINIIDNAFKFSDNKTVEINVVSEKNNIILLFIDQGIGIPESYLKHVFEPFYRGSNTHGISGKGIGLSLVRRIIKLHSGKIFIRSTLNKGTTVEVVLPNLS